MSAAANPEVDEFSVLVARAEKSAAERERALDVLANLYACVNDKAWMPSEVQSVVREAKAVLVEAGRKVR